MAFLQDLRYGVRMLVKDKWFTLVAATALGLGIGVNTTVFSLVNAVLIRGLPFPRSEEIVYLATRNTTRGADDSSPASWREFEDWRAKSRSYAAIAAFRTQQFNLSDPDHPAERAQRRGGYRKPFRPARPGAGSRARFRGRRGRRWRCPGRHHRSQHLEESLRQRSRRHRQDAEAERGCLHNHRRDAAWDALSHQRRFVAAADAAGSRRASGAQYQRLRPARPWGVVESGGVRDDRHLERARGCLPGHEQGHGRRA